MATTPLSKGNGYEVGVNYNASNGRISGVYCNNSGPHQSIYCKAVLTDGRTFGTLPGDAGATPVFGVGQGQLVSIPGTAVTVSTDASGEVIFNGLQSVAVVPAD